MTEKNIFVYILFFSLNISDFSYFLVTATPTWKRSLPPSQQPPLKIKILPSPAPFWKFDTRFTPPAPVERGRGGMDTMPLQGEFYIEHETKAFIAPGKPLALKQKMKNINRLIVFKFPLKCYTGHQILSIIWREQKISDENICWKSNLSLGY